MTHQYKKAIRKKMNFFSWLNLKNNTSEKGFVIYRGEEVIGKRSAVSVIPWWDL